MLFSYPTCYSGSMLWLFLPRPLFFSSFTHTLQFIEAVHTLQCTQGTQRTTLERKGTETPGEHKEKQRLVMET